MSEAEAETENKPQQQQQQPSRKHVRQPPSVPFIWEQRPGLPIKDWKPSHRTTTTAQTAAAAAPPPVKLVASVPFAWEDTPGKPFPCFTPESTDPPPEFLCLPPPPVYANHSIGDRFDEASSDTDDDDASSDSFSSANCLVSSDAISGSVPVDEFDDLKREMTASVPTSPAYESDDSSSSYMTGASSLVGASFLEKLFPLLPPESGLVRRRDDSEDVLVSRALAEVKPRASDTSSGFPVRKALTLGELIMISRRRSYMGRAIEMRKQNPPMVKVCLKLLLHLFLLQEFSKNEAVRCCVFVPGIKMMEGLEWKKFQQRLKLI